MKAQVFSVGKYISTGSAQQPRNQLIISSLFAQSTTCSPELLLGMYSPLYAVVGFLAFEYFGFFTDSFQAGLPPLLDSFFRVESIRRREAEEEGVEDCLFHRICLGYNLNYKICQCTTISIGNSLTHSLTHSLAIYLLRTT